MGDAESLVAANMIWLAFFFLLRPREYTGSGRDAHPFSMKDASLWAGSQPVNCRTATDDELRAVAFLALTFSDQITGREEKPWAMASQGTHTTLISPHP